MANLTHLFYEYQEVKIKNNDFDAVKKWNNGMVKEVYEDHIIVTNTDCGIDGYYEEGFNIHCIYPLYRVTLMDRGNLELNLNELRKNFELGIKELLSNYSDESMNKWLKRCIEVESIPASEFYKWVLEELTLVREQYDIEIARQLFNYGEIFTLDPYEIKGAAKYLKAGGDINKICNLTLKGLLD